MGYQRLDYHLMVLLALLTLASCGEIVGFRQDTAEIGDLPRFDLYMGDDDLNVLYESLVDSTYASCQFDDGGGRRRGKIRIRGNSSRMEPKKSFTLAYDDRGTTVKYALDSGGDPWFLYDIAMLGYSYVGLPAPTLEPAALFLNGSYLGYYSLIRMYSEELDDFYGVHGGELYKFFINIYSPEYSLQGFSEKKFPDDDDFSRFNGLLANVENMSSPDWVAWAEENVDMESVAGYLAVSNYLGINDISKFNFYVYFGDEIVILPWDNDRGLNSLGPGGDNDLTNRMFESPVFLECYEDALKTYFLEPGPDNIVPALRERLDELQEILDVAARNSPVFFLTYESFLEEKTEFETFLATRSDDILADPGWAEYLQ